MGTLRYVLIVVLSRFQVQKRNYRYEKQRATKELLSMLKDPSVVIIADWLKVRGSLKSWMKLWCILKPGLLVLYKSHKAKVKFRLGNVGIFNPLPCPPRINCAVLLLLQVAFCLREVRVFPCAVCAGLSARAFLYND